MRVKQAARSPRDLAHAACPRGASRRCRRSIRVTGAPGRGRSSVWAVAVDGGAGGSTGGSEAALAHDRNVKQLILIACILGSSIALLDGTIVNVALPTIQRSLEIGRAHV